MKELVEAIAKALVDSPDDVVVTEKKLTELLLLNLRLPRKIWVRLLATGRIAKQSVQLLKRLHQKAIKKLLLILYNSFTSVEGVCISVPFDFEYK